MTTDLSKLSKIIIEDESGKQIFSIEPGNISLTKLQNKEILLTVREMPKKKSVIKGY